MRRLHKNKSIVLIIITFVILSFGLFTEQFLGWGRIIRYAKYIVFPAKTLMDNNVMELELEYNALLETGYKDWLVHPSVEYIPEGLNGHQWWLAVTPYKGSHGNRSDWEQPLLFYGDGNTLTPPNKWKFAGIVQDKHERGFNADPNLYYFGGKLWVIWKESGTPNTKEECAKTCIMGRWYDGNQFGPIRKLFDNNSSEMVHLTAPVLLMVNDTLRCLATDFEHVRKENILLPRGHSGLALWNASNMDLDSADFTYCGTLYQDYSADFDYWHADHTWDSETRMYYSVVSNEIADKILVGVSSDGLHFKYAETPLYSKTGNHFINTYKPAIEIVGDMTWFFFPKCDVNWTKCHIYCGGIKTTELFELINTDLK